MSNFNDELLLFCLNSYRMGVLLAVTTALGTLIPLGKRKKSLITETNVVMNNVLLRDVRRKHLLHGNKV